MHLMNRSLSVVLEQFTLNSYTVNNIELLLRETIPIETRQSSGDEYLGLDARKPVFGSLRTTRAQTSLRNRAV